WTARVTPVMAERRPSPTHVGMDRTSSGRRRRAVTKPHARGDGPFRIAMAPRGAPQAPRTWGWTEPGNSRKRKTTPSPTHVGMDRAAGRTDATRQTKPRARGDGPTGAEYLPRGRPQAPRTWGWTAAMGKWDDDIEPSPTHVGMDRRSGS